MMKGCLISKCGIVKKIVLIAFMMMGALEVSAMEKIGQQVGDSLQGSRSSLERERAWFNLVDADDSAEKRKQTTSFEGDGESEAEGDFDACLLSMVVQLGNAAATRKLLEKGASARQVDAEGRSLLMLATTVANVDAAGDTMALLLRHGATLDHQDLMGATVWDYAKERPALAHLLRFYQQYKKNGVVQTETHTRFH